MTVVERWTLPNGMTVLYRQDGTFPLASGTLLFRSGSRRETRSEAGLCSMTIDLLMQGTRRRSARQIARVMESVGASLSAQAHEDYAEMGFVAPAFKIDRVLDIAAEALEQPSFPQDEIAKEKDHVIASLASRRDAIFNLAYDQVNQMLYGNHPYSWPLEGREKTVPSFKRNDFQQWHLRNIRPEGGIVSLVSPLSGKEILKRLQKTIGLWRPGLSTRRVLPLPRVQTLKVSQTHHKRSSFEQAYLMVAWQAPGATHQDQLPLKVLNTLMGGGMSSRLFLTLRETLGLAYEVSSFYPTRLDVSHWVIYLGLPADKLRIASKKLNELLDHAAHRRPTDGELRQAQSMIRGAFLMDRQSRRRQAWYRAWWEFLGRGDGYGEEFLKAIDAVTPAQVLRAARDIMAQPRVTVTVVPK
jgi:zinc protease